MNFPSYVRTEADQTQNSVTHTENASKSPPTHEVPNPQQTNYQAAVNYSQPDTNMVQPDVYYQQPQQQFRYMGQQQTYHHNQRNRRRNNQMFYY